MFYFLLIIIPLMPLQNVVDKIPKGPSGVNFQNIVLILMFLFWTLRSNAKGRSMVRPNQINVALVLYLILSFLGMWRSSIYLNIDFPISISDPHVIFWKDYFTTLCFFWFALGIVDNDDEMFWLTVAMAVVMPYMFRVHYAQLMAASSWHYDHDLRVKGTFSHLGSNELAAFYTQYGMIFFCMAWFLKKWWHKAFFGGAALLCLWGVVYSYSRSSYIALVACLLIFALVQARTLIPVMVGFLFIAPAVLPASVMDRIEMTQDSDGKLDDSAAHRLDFWELAWEKFLENPIQGIGYHAFHHINPMGLDTHNMYVKQLCELGIFGIILFMVLYFAAINESTRLYREADTPYLKALGLGMVMCVVSNMLLNIFGDRGSYTALATYYWVFLGMVVRGRELAAARRAAGLGRAQADPGGVDSPKPPDKPRGSIFAQQAQAQAQAFDGDDDDTGLFDPDEIRQRNK